MNIQESKIYIEKEMRMQRALDHSIFDAKGLTRRQTVENRRIALMVELGEFLNELGYLWKYWKEGAVPSEEQKARATEEACDVLHFIYSKAIDVGVLDTHHNIIFYHNDPLKQMNDVLEFGGKRIDSYSAWHRFFALFRGLLYHADIDWVDVKKAYHEKNKVNLERLESGY
jgi:dimeric dUTPase (all-alpha-NTP-PPase superfamily)